jgi:membrane protease YdiL (CAAX protease family)
MLIIINGVIFGLLHFGYGLESFLSSWLFGIAFAIIVILQNSIEFVAGAHNANNLLLSLVFLDLSEATNEKFSWAINWVDFSVHIVALLLLVGVVFMFFKRNHIGLSKKSLFLLGSILLLSQQSFSQSNSISKEWINKNVHTINNDSQVM